MLIKIIYIFLTLSLNCIFVYGQLADQKSSFAFVIDDTGSMQDDIDQVKSKTELIFDKIVASGTSSIGNVVLVTFNDPGVRPALITTDVNTFKTTLYSIVADGGADCPEMAMTGIEVALSNTLPRSYIYVFTDASAKDYEKFPKIKRMAQKQGSQIVFLLTGECNPFYESDPGYKVYHDLASATSGQVFHVDKGEIGQVLDFVGKTLDQRRAVLATAVLPPGYDKTLSFPADKEIDDIHIAVSGLKPKAEVLKPDGSDAKTTDIFKNIGVEKLGSGNFTAKVGSETSTSVVITGATAINFQHGFTGFKPTSIKTTVTRPIAGKPSFLAIELSSKAKDVKLNEVELLDLDDNVISVRPLKEVGKDFYVAEKELPPTSIFRIAVKGYNTKTKEPIKRLSFTPIEPQTPSTEEIAEKRAPTVTLIGDPTREVPYGEPLQVQCKINAYPAPKVQWVDEKTGLTISEMAVEEELPYDYISILDLEQVKINTSYQCRASNEVGQDDTTVTVRPIDRFVALNVSKDTSIDYDDEGKLYCIIDANPPAQITWYLNGDLLDNDENLEKSEDGSVLNIIYMKPKFEGKYNCEARNELKREIYYINLVMTGTAVPKIDDSVNQVNVTRKENATISCKVIEGIPQPGIRWSFKHRYAQEFVVLDSYSDILEISSTDINAAGTYKCEAFNLFGKAEHEIELVVKYPPKITSKRHTIKTKSGEYVYLTCQVDGMPRPNVKWTFNGIEIKKSLRQRIYRDNMLGMKVSIKDSGTYNCTAVNELGSDTKIVNLTIYDPVRITPPIKSTLKTKVGSTIVLPCEAFGHPTPSIKWVFIKEHDHSELLRPSDPSGSLQVSRVQLEQSGQYLCIAENIGGSSNITYTLQVLAPPHIVKSSVSKSITAVVNDLILTLPCEAKGNPKPTIIWTKDELRIPSGTYWHDIKDDGTLVIKNVDDITQGRYVCIAENSLGTDTDYFDVLVQNYPDASEKRGVLDVQLGRSTKIYCDIPHTSTDRLTWYKDSILIATGELYLNDINMGDNGLYTCRVNTFSGATSASKMVNVGFPPYFNEAASEVIYYVADAEAYLSCLATGVPTPTVTWLHNDIPIEFTEMAYRFYMSSNDLGRFSCTVSNSYGTISRDFNIISQCSFKAEMNPDSPTVSVLDARDTTKPDDVIVNIPVGEEIIIYCIKGFEIFPGTELKATCVQDTMLKIGDKEIKYNDIKCRKDVTPITKPTGKRCSPTKRDTETIKVGIETDGKFDEVFEICYDKFNSIPIYSTHKINRSLAGVEPTDVNWYDNDLVRYNYDELYDCTNQMYHINAIRPLARGLECCFTKRKLVNPQDVSPGVSQIATYSNLNIVPHWSTCGTKNWDDIEMRIRILAKPLNRNLIVRTGTSGQLQFPTTSLRMQNIFIHDRSNKRQPVPKFLWKVVQDEFSRSSLAIIQVNVPDLKLSEALSYVVCKDICNLVEWMKSPVWRDVKYGFTYCCTIKEFETAFGLEGQFSIGLEGIFSDTLIIPDTGRV
ncbi:hemicentin-1 isoform X2 [Papilio machaon]|uniref:hemicentin-1 isoform X2 n=1 Tax=Papilio machaon TaxID=76193 RepID=UPI001E6648FC|nr:hemicentin-1 isoform X2 [Papilio machaon]